MKGILTVNNLDKNLRLKEFTKERKKCQRSKSWIGSAKRETERTMIKTPWEKDKKEGERLRGKKKAHMHMEIWTERWTQKTGQRLMDIDTNFKVSYQFLGDVGVLHKIRWWNIVIMKGNLKCTQYSQCEWNLLCDDIYVPYCVQRIKSWKFTFKVKVNVPQLY